LSRPDNGKCYQPPVHVILLWGTKGAVPQARVQWGLTIKKPQD